MRRRGVALLLCVSACGWELDVGTLEGGARPLGDTCAPEIVPYDCTAGRATCNFDSDCAGLRCNLATHRCFDPGAPCEGTACVFDRDCSGNERCNNKLQLCADMRGPQTCRPCTFDDDCGGATCKTFSHECG